MILKERGLRDRDFISTKEDLLFCVVGPYHPANRVISYLKYLPDPEGKWRKGKDRFKRIMRAYTIPSLLETFDFLKVSYPKYLFFSSVYNITMTAVPREYITKHFKPEEKLTRLFKKSHLDSLQRKVIRFVALLSELSGISVDDFGVTGSILLGIHNPVFSDMDITTYGVESSYAVKGALTGVCSTGNFGVGRFEEEKLRNWYINKTRNHPISLDEAERIYKRKWNIGAFEGTIFSVRPIKMEQELTEEYGDKAYHSAGTVTIQAVVVDSKDSIFLPAVYRVREVEVKEDVEADIEEVVSYEGLYDSLAEKGEEIEVNGKLEHVIDNRTGREYDRVLVGSPEGKGGEYIKPL